MDTCLICMLGRKQYARGETVVWLTSDIQDIQGYIGYPGIHKISGDTQDIQGYIRYPGIYRIFKDIQDI